MHMNEEECCCKFPNNDPLYFCVIPCKAFLNSIISSHDCKMFMMLTPSTIILILPMTQLTLGLVCALLKVQE